MTHDDSNENSQQGEGRGEAVLSIFKRGAEFTKQLLSENEALRKELRDLHDRQNEASQCPDQWEQLRQELKHRITTLEEENQQMRDQLTEALEGIVALEVAFQAVVQKLALFAAECGHVRGSGAFGQGCRQASKAQRALGDDVLLDFAGPAVDGRCAREVVLGGRA